MKGYCCSDCDHWERSQNRLSAGKCKKNPPVIQFILAPTGALGQAGTVGVTAWPETGAEFGACGSFAVVSGTGH